MKGAGLKMSRNINEPLLYIDQPTFQKPKAFMQDYYYNDSTKDQLEEEQLEEKMKENSSEHKTGSFKDLSIDKKIAYLSDLPANFPAIRCEFITKDNKYRGVLLKHDETDLTVRVLGKEKRIIKREDLTDIQMLGF